MIYFFYIVRCIDNSLYSGVTTELERRVEEHNTHVTKGAKYTKSRRPVTLVYFEKYKTKSAAMKREWEVKQLSKEEKEKIVKKLESNSY